MKKLILLAACVSFAAWGKAQPFPGGFPKKRGDKGDEGRGRLAGRKLG